jgi:hypothetical protein
MFQTYRQLRQRIKWQRETIEDLYERLEDLSEDYVALEADSADMYLMLEALRAAQQA